VVGNNDDWFSDVGFLVVNKRNVRKRALPHASGKPLEWTSKYGSLTLNFDSVGSPSGGMNEAGLVIDESWLDETAYPRRDRRPVIDEVQWIQYQLDNCATVDEVLRTDGVLRIELFTGKSHYFVCDRSGKVAVVEWVGGEMVAHVLSRDDVQIITNDTYTKSLEVLKKHRGFGGAAPCGQSGSSLDRFCRAATMVKRFAGDDRATAAGQGFEILANVSQKSTMFSWIYDIGNRSIHYKTAASPRIKTVRLDTFQFDCRGPMLMADVLTDRAGDISSNFEPYTLEKNRDFVARVIKKWRANGFALHITDAEVEKMIHYPETLECAAR
jgi:choloylglycine hydrolase